MSGGSSQVRGFRARHVYILPRPNRNAGAPLGEVATTSQRLHERGSRLRTDWAAWFSRPWRDVLVCAHLAAELGCHGRLSLRQPALAGQTFFARPGSEAAARQAPWVTPGGPCSPLGASYTAPASSSRPRAIARIRSNAIARRWRSVSDPIDLSSRTAARARKRRDRISPQPR